MIIKSVRVQHYRCILDAELLCEPLTALVGPNGCGKSSFLRAIELFYAPTPRITQDDFYNRDTAQNIQVSITFTDLSREAQERFAPYLEDEELTVTRILSLTEGKATNRYHGLRLQVPDFLAVREATSAAQVKQEYEQLRRSETYDGLPTYRSKDAALEALAGWEREHPESCVRQQDNDQFFGFTEVARGYLGKYTQFIYIPAVRDAGEDAADGRGSPIAELMDAMVRSTLAAREDLQEFREITQQAYERLMAHDNLTELQGLEERLSTTLRTYVPEARVRLAWLPEAAFNLPLPRADVRLEEDGYAAPVGRTGHGMQRAFVLSMLQQLAVAQVPHSTPGSLTQDDSDEESSRDLPTLILGIEEPELYQHPNRQRSFARTLLRLAEGVIPGVAQRTQVLYGTHCPHFVGIDRFHQVRVLRKVGHGGNMPRVTQVTAAEGEAVATELWEATGRLSSRGQPTEPFTWATLRPRLLSVMTPTISEGFFADVVVLVEGDLDRAAILGTAHHLDFDLESLGISVIPCNGKTNLDRPLVIFRKFGLPTFVIWDGDHGASNAREQENHALLRLVDEPVEDWPATRVGKHFACFRRNLEQTLRDDLGNEVYDTLCNECQTEFGISKRDDVLKHPVFFEKLLSQAEAGGAVPQTLKDIVLAVVGLGSALDAPDPTPSVSGHRGRELTLNG